MRRVHCRKCWQSTPLLARQCTHCGHADAARRVQGLAELAAYVAGGAGTVVLLVWMAVVYI